jgi:ATP-dependent Clp protease ATP-binding subunit ClpA
MVELALPRQLHAIGRRAIVEATARRAGTVEAEHLLLAILADTSSPASIALAKSGVDYGRFERALDAERSRSLAAAGITPLHPAQLSATPRTTGPGWGASIRDVLRTADKPAAKQNRPGALELELARSILAVNLGTVARAIALAGSSRKTLLDELASG